MNQNNQEHSAKFAFLYMLSLAALIFTGLSVGMIIFQIINKYVPDALNQLRSAFSSSQLRFAISALIVAGPVFFITTRQIYKNLFQGKLASDSGVRKWLTYFILLVSSVIMLGWFIGLVNNYLSGELTTKFILKAITAIGIAGLGFSFYFYDIKRERVVGVKDKRIRLYFIVSLIIALAAFIFGLFLVESPSQVRNQKLDAEIVNDAITLEDGINEFYRINSSLPETLQELKDEVVFITQQDLQDPVTNQIYEYKILSEDEYQLCAEFRTSNLENSSDRDLYYRNWPHQAGKDCIEKKVSQNQIKDNPIPVN